MTPSAQHPDDDAHRGPAVLVISVERAVVAWSTGATRLMRRSADEALGRSFDHMLDEIGIFDPEGPPDVYRVRGPHSPPLDVLRQEIALDGWTHKVVLLTPVQRAEEIRWGTALYRSLFEQNRIGVVLRDTDLLVLKTNESAWKEFLPVRSSLPDVLGPEEGRSAERPLRAVLETGVPQTMQDQPVRYLNRPGIARSLSVSALRLRDEAAHPLGVAVLLTDATDQWLAHQRLRLRHTATKNLGQSLDLTRTAEEVVDLLVPAFGHITSVDLASEVLEGNEPPTSSPESLRLRRIAVRAAGGTWPAALLPRGTTAPPLHGVPGLMRRLRQGSAFVVGRESLERLLSGTSLVPLVVPDDGRWLAVAPMVGRHMLLGVITLWRTDGDEEFTREDTDLLTEIATYAALSLDNARRYLREHDAAVELQRRLLPQGSLRTTTMETAGIYRPSGGEAEVGGDWFDAIALPSLRVALVIGDVTGHGLSSAVLMGQLRAAVQTLAQLEIPADEIMFRLDELVSRLASEMPADQRDTVGATCLIILFDPVAEQCTVVSAGHMPPLVTSQEGETRVIPVRPDPPLGVSGGPFEAVTFALRPGSRLALYTDGLLGGKSSARDVDEAIGHLADRLAESGDLTGVPLEHICRGLLGDWPAAADDAALLLARSRSLPADTVVSWEFAAASTSVAKARHEVQRQLDRWGFTDLVFATEIIVSELVTNAVRYAGGPIVLRLIRDTVLICEVSDPSNTQPRLRRARETDEGGRGLFLVAQLSTRWGSRYGENGKTIWAEQEITVP
ncbi:SpoIIE family protein phosphatase [Streptomyces sp. NPDC086010]|uniref:ATP-binding SpoIIE family protein phosphatase n=1 Tax=Streptomyces sp. NPDC086010 TaxID=3365745 RepID=UPI0037D77143